MASARMHRRILMIGGEGVVLFAPNGRTMAREIAIPWDAPDFDGQLSAALAGKKSGMPLLILFDGADQAYRKEENIPKLSPFDRPRFVKRKLELAFPSYSIRAALPIKPRAVKGMPKSSAPPSYLFVALPEVEHLDRVGNALFESGAPVAGFGLLPVESAGLVDTLSHKIAESKKEKPARWSILIGQHETGGLRQVIVKDGNLALARLTPPSEAGIGGAGWAEDVVRGFKETMAYISRFGYTPAEGLQVTVICSDADKPFFENITTGGPPFHCLNAGEALELLGIRAFGLNRALFADIVHAAWSAKRSTPLLPLRVPSIHRVMTPRLLARVATILLVFLGVGLSVLTAEGARDYFALRQDLDGRQSRLETMQREYDQEAQAFDKLPVRPDAIKAALEIKKTLEVDAANPDAVLSRLKEGLGQDIHLDSLAFDYLPANSFQTVGSGAVPSMPVADAKGRVKLRFNFHLPEAIPLEKKVARAEELQKNLQRIFPGWQVKIVAQFGRISRIGTFQGGVGGDAAQRLLQDAGAAELMLEGPA